jgi:hypothetical protein
MPIGKKSTTRARLEAAARPAWITDAVVVALEGTRAVLACTRDGRTLVARRPHHVEAAWLAAAVAIAPVEATLAIDEEGRAILWCVYPGPEHDRACPAELEIRTASKLKLTCGDSSMTLDEHGRVRVRGAEIVSDATYTNFVRGGSVKIN